MEKSNLKLIKNPINQKENYEDAKYCSSLFENLSLFTECGVITEELLLNVTTVLAEKFATELYKISMSDLVHDGSFKEIRVFNSIYLSNVVQKIRNLENSSKTMPSKYKELVKEKTYFLQSYYNDLMGNNIVPIEFGIKNKIMRDMEPLRIETMTDCIEYLNDIVGVSFGTKEINKSTLQTNMKFLNKYYTILSDKRNQASFNNLFATRKRLNIPVRYGEGIKDNCLLLSSNEIQNDINPYFLLVICKFLSYVPKMDYDFMVDHLHIYEHFGETLSDYIDTAVEDVLNEQVETLYSPQLELSQFDINMKKRK